MFVGLDIITYLLDHGGSIYKNLFWTLGVQVMALNMTLKTSVIRSDKMTQYCVNTACVKDTKEGVIGNKQSGVLHIYPLNNLE